MPISKPTSWWRRKRNPKVWHFVKACPSSPRTRKDLDLDMMNDWYTPIVLTKSNPKSGTKCDHCQRLQKAAKGK